VDSFSARECFAAFGRLAAGLAVGFVVSDAFFLFDSYVVKLCGIKDFSALLALDILGIFVARDDFYDGVFAGGGHGWGGANGMDFARIERGCQPSIPLFSLVSGWFVSGRKIGKAGCVPVVPDVHYLGLELSAFGAFQR
jgi:hypothetical protein